ncbi:MAG: hypothetical protein ACPK85_00815 [Methanosarcina sp.]
MGPMAKKKKGKIIKIDIYRRQKNFAKLLLNFRIRSKKQKDSKKAMGT